jgi:hypothetical protein
MTTRECEPAPTSLAPSAARTVNSILPPVDFRHLGLPGNRASNLRRREMALVDRRADSTLTGIEIGFDRVEGGIP